MVYSCNIQQEWYKFRDIDKKHDQFIDNIITDKAKWVEKGTQFPGKGDMHQIKKGSLTYYGQLDESTGQPHGIGRMTFNCSSIYEGVFVDGVR